MPLRSSNAADGLFSSTGDELADRELRQLIRDLQDLSRNPNLSRSEAAALRRVGRPEPGDDLPAWLDILDPVADVFDFAGAPIRRGISEVLPYSNREGDVSGLDLVRDTAAAFGFIDSPDENIPYFPDVAAGLAVEIGADPVSYLGAPAIAKAGGSVALKSGRFLPDAITSAKNLIASNRLRWGTAIDAGRAAAATDEVIRGADTAIEEIVPRVSDGFEFASKATATERRLNRDELTEELTARLYVAVEEGAIKFSNAAAAERAANTLTAVAKEGKIGAVVKAAEDGVGGLSRDMLRPLGLTGNLRFAGREIPGTAKITSMFEEVFSAVRGARLPVDIPLVGGSRMPTPLRIADAVKQSALSEWFNTLMKGEDGMRARGAFEAWSDTQFAEASRAAFNKIEGAFNDAIKKQIKHLDLESKYSEAELRSMMTQLRPAAAQFVRLSDEARLTSDFWLQPKTPESITARLDVLRGWIDNDEIIEETGEPLISDGFKMLAPSIAIGLAELGSVSSLKNWRAGGSIGNVLQPTLQGGKYRSPLGIPMETSREWMEGMSVVKTLDSAGGLAKRWGEVDEQLLDELVGAAENLDAWKTREGAEEVLLNFGLLDSQIDDQAKQLLDRVTGSLESGAGRDVSSGIPFMQRTAQARIREAYWMLETGDYRGLQRAFDNISGLFDRHVYAYDNLITERLSEGQLKAELLGIGNSRRGAQRLEAIEGWSPERLLDESLRIVTSYWYRPDFWVDESVLRGRSRAYEQLRAFDPVDRVVLAKTAELGDDWWGQVVARGVELSQSWKDLKQQTAEMRDLIDRLVADPDASEVLKRIETFYSYARVVNDHFGQGARVLAGLVEDTGQVLRSKQGKVVSGDYVLGAENGAVSLLDEMEMNLDQFRDAVQSLRLQGSGNLLPRADMPTVAKRGDEGFDLLMKAQGEAFGSLAADTLRFMQNLKKAHIGADGETMNAVFDSFAKTNRIYKRMFLANGNYLRRNFQGQWVLNWLESGTTAKQYREWLPMYNMAREAIEDETSNLLASGSSAVWKKFRKKFGAENLRIAQAIFDSGQGASRSGAFTLERAMDPLETPIGKVAGRGVDFLDRQKARFEQLWVWVAQSATTRRLQPRPSRSQFGVDNIMSSAKAELETWMRTSQMYGLMSQGETVQRALNAVGKTHFHYWDLTNKGQVLDELMPFYVFRSRITALAIENAFSTPGLPSRLIRASNVSAEEDPFGVGNPQFASGGRYFLGAGQGMGGVGWAFDFGDPMAEGVDTALNLTGFVPGAAAITGRNYVDLAQEEVIGSLSPLASLVVMPALNLASSASGLYEDEFRPAAYYDGIGPRLASALGSTPGLEVGKVLEFTGHFEMVEGEPYLTRTGALWLGEVIPLLANIEPFLAWAGATEGQRPREATVEGRASRLERDSMQALFNLIGVPFKLLSPDQRAAYVRNAQFETRNYNRLLSYMDDLEGGGNWWENTIGSG